MPFFFIMHLFGLLLAAVPMFLKTRWSVPGGSFEKEGFQSVLTLLIEVPSLIGGFVNSNTDWMCPGWS